MKRNNWFVPGIILAGLILIGFSLWAPQGQFGFNFNQKSLAVVVEKSGTVTFQNNEMPAETKLETKQKLEALDTLRTNPESEILVQFNDGGQFRLGEKSEVVLDLLDNGSPLVVIRSGEISIEKFGASPSFWVRSEGQLYSAADYVMVDKRSARNLKDESPKNPDREQITQAEIEGVLNGKKA
ncbi:MAG: FecR family protein, partial [Bdellovibrionaceae bacterium]|nr:FecR family protein [Pseudobdellovibrionaceae bacterium]